MHLQFAPEDQRALDEMITGNKKLPALIFIRRATGCGLDEALEILVARYDELRRDKPEMFSETHEGFRLGTTGYRNSTTKVVFHSEGYERSR